MVRKDAALPSRFITASYTNAVFDRFMNSRIEGAKVNQGLRKNEDEDEDDDGEDNDELNPVTAAQDEPGNGKE